MPTLIVMVAVAAVGVALSVALMVTLVAVCAVTRRVPDITPALLILSHDGYAPSKLNVYGVVPPDTPPLTLIEVMAAPVAPEGMS